MRSTSMYSLLLQRSRKAGLEIMGQVLGVVYDRENISDEALLAFSKDRDGIIQAYETFIAPAIDELEEALLNVACEED